LWNHTLVYSKRYFVRLFTIKDSLNAFPRSHIQYPFLSNLTNGKISIIDNLSCHFVLFPNFNTLFSVNQQK